MNALQLITPDSRDIIRQLHERGEIRIPELTEIHRAQKQEDRVIIREYENIHESVKTTVEIYYFG